MGSHGRPAAGQGIRGPPRQHHLGFVQAVIHTQKAIPIRVEARQFRVHGKEGKMVAALPVLRLVVDDRTLYLHFAGAQVALEVGLIVMGIPEAELQKGKEGQGLCPFALVGQTELHHFSIEVHGHEKELIDPKASPGPGDFGVTQAVTALIERKFLFHGPKAGRPHIFAVFNVEAAPALIQGYVIVPIAG